MIKQVSSHRFDLLFFFERVFFERVFFERFDLLFFFERFDLLFFFERFDLLFFFDRFFFGGLSLEMIVF